VSVADWVRGLIERADRAGAEVKHNA